MHVFTHRPLSFFFIPFYYEVKEITGTRKDSWRGNLIKEREVKNAIKKHIADEAEAGRIFELVKNQGDY